MPIKKTFRFDDEIGQMLQELKTVYQAKSENHLCELIVRDIYEIKKAKALVPFEELNKRDKELQKAIFELGRLRQATEDREKQIQELKEEKQNLEQKLEEQLKEKAEKKKGFWARLFGL